uniref:Defensin-like protein n=1 Tax=Steinernema glaseri TaxID=37863 RepID=A0A1I7ZBW2_9BILA
MSIIMPFHAVRPTGSDVQSSKFFFKGIFNRIPPKEDKSSSVRIRMFRIIHTCVLLIIVLAVSKSLSGTIRNTADEEKEKLIPMSRDGPEVAIDYEFIGSRKGQRRPTQAPVIMSEQSRNCSFNVICTDHRLFECPGGCMGFFPGKCKQDSCQKFNECFDEKELARDCSCDCMPSGIREVIQSSVVTRCCK